MAKYRHIISVQSNDHRGRPLAGHMAVTLCGRVAAYGRFPNVPQTDPRFCPRCLVLAD